MHLKYVLRPNSLSVQRVGSLLDENNRNFYRKSIQSWPQRQCLQGFAKRLVFEQDFSGLAQQLRDFESLPKCQIREIFETLVWIDKKLIFRDPYQ